MAYEDGYLIPLSDVLADVWPTDLVELPTEIGDALAGIGIARLDAVPPARASVKIIFREELSLEIPGLSGLELVIGAPEREPGVPPPEVTEIDLTIDLGPLFFLEVGLLTELRFPADVVQALDREETPEGTVYTMAADPRAYIQLDAAFSFDGAGNFSFSPAEEPTFHLPALSIGGSPPSGGDPGRIGFILDIPEVALILDEPREEPLPAELPAGFRGVFIPSATARLPPDMNVGAQIELTNGGLGTGGFTGVVAIEFGVPPSPEPPEANLFGILFQLREVSCTFVQGSLTEGGFSGEVYLPFFERWLGATITIGSDGDFAVSIDAARQDPEEGEATPDGLLVLEKEGVMRLQLDSLGFEREDDEFTISLGGRVRPLIGDIDWPELEIQRITIFPDGSVHIDGGWVDLPTTQTLNFFGFRLSVSRLGFGNEHVETPTGTKHYEWFGADGEIALVEGIPIAGSVRGLKFRWEKGDLGTMSVTLEGVGISLEIPGTLELAGSVSFITRQPGEGLTGLAMQRFEGALRLAITPLRMEVSAQVLIAQVQFPEGEQTAFMIVLDTTFPTGIMLGATGVSIYGLAGLFAMHMAPDRLVSSSTEKTWYEWWKEGDTEPDRYTVATINKWEPELDTFAFGIGAKLGTAMDDGYTINAGVLLAVIVPGPIVIIDGKINLLKQRSGSNDQEGAFHVLIVIDGRAGTFLLAIDIYYSIEDVLEVEGGMEAFFNFNDSNDWHIYIGQKDPETKRIRARILSLVEASTYFMVDPRQLALGAKASLGFRGEYGPLLIVLEIALGFDVTLVWKPFQMTGEIFVRGHLAVKIFGIGIELLIEAILGGSAPDPYHIFGVFHCKIELFWPIPPLEADVRVEWGPTGAAVPFVPFFKNAAFLHRKSPGNSWAIAADGSTAMPADSVLVLSFNRRIGEMAVASAIAPPSNVDIVDGHTFRYDVRAIILEVDDGGAWVPYASNLGTPRPFPFIGERSLLTPADAQEPRLALWTVDPYPGSSEFALPDAIGRRPPCGTGATPELHEIHWTRVPNGTRYAYEFRHMGALFSIDLDKGSIVPIVVSPRLRMSAGRVRFGEPLERVTLKFATGFSGTVWVAAFRDGVQLSRQLFDVAATPEFEIYPPSGLDVVRIEPANAQTPTILLERITYITERERADADRTSPATVDPSTEVGSYGLMFLEPGRAYRLTVRVATSIDGSVPSAAEEAVSQVEFRTLAGPGIEPPPPPPTVSPPPEPTQEETLRAGHLNRAETYVDATLPPAGARVFYGDEDVAVVFDNPYMSSFYPDEDLKLRVKDPEAAVVVSGAPIALEGAFWDSPFFLSWLAAIERGGCAPAGVPAPRARELRLAVSGLRARTAYTIELGTDDKMLFSFPAVTSRYGSFAAHVEDVGPGPVVPRRLSVAAPTPVGWIASFDATSSALASAVVALEAATEALGYYDALAQVTAARQAYEAARTAGYGEMQSAASISERPPEVPRIEASLVVFADGGRALVVESPEPLPIDRLVLSVLLGGATPTTSRVLPNADRTRLVIVPASLPDGPHTLRWTYASAPGGPVATRTYIPISEQHDWSLQLE